MSPVMLGPVMLCHKRTEEAVRTLFDALFEKCPGLQEYVRVIGTEGEKSLLNVTCYPFKDFIRLLCSVHSKKNVKKMLTDLVNDQKFRQKVYVDTISRFVYCKTIEDFDVTCELLKSSWGTYVALNEFAEYFEKFKAMNLKYHIIKGVWSKNRASLMFWEMGNYTQPMLCVTNVIKMSQKKSILTTSALNMASYLLSKRAIF